jgi:hypothetical protein
MLKAESLVQEVLRALYFYGADYILLKMGHSEKLVHKEQMISLMELGHERTTVGEMSVMTLSEPAAARTRVEDVPPDTALLMFFRKGEGPEGALSMTSFGEYRERKIKEAETVYPEWWEAPLPLLYMDDERVALNGAAGAKIPCEAKELAAQADKMKRDGMITVKNKKRELTFSLHSLEENVYLIEDVSGDFEMAEELLWWAAVGKAFVRRVEENGAVVRRVSPLEAPPASAAEVLPCFWDNEPLGSVAIGMPGGADGNETPAPGAVNEEKEDEAASPDAKDAAEPDASPEPEPRETQASERAEDSETGAVVEKPSRGKRARPAKKGKREKSALWEPRDDLNLDLNAISEPSKEKDEPVAKPPETPIPGVWHESFGPFGKPAAKKSRAADQAGQDAGEKSDDEEHTETEPDVPPAAEQEGTGETGGNVKTEEPGKTAAPKVFDKNAARKAYGSSRQRKAPGDGENA